VAPAAVAVAAIDVAATVATLAAAKTPRNVSGESIRGLELGFTSTPVSAGRQMRAHT
jgi:hypothetical protein